MSEPAQPVVVFDCMTFLQAAISPTGPAAACLRLVEAGVVLLVTSPVLFDEIRDVFNRPKIRRRNPRLTDEAVGAFLGRIATLAPPRPDAPTVFPYPRDPKDEPYLNLAIASGAKCLVSRDNDLLDLMRDDNADGKTLRALCPGLTILDPVAFLQQITSGTGDKPTQ